MTVPTVSVVVPHFEQHRTLDLVLAALDLAHPVPGGFEVVVADDGSASLPEPGVHSYPVQVVTHPRAGFRAGTTRNLGARHTRGAVLCFLDADTVPGPGYVVAMAAATRGPGTLAVGRRRHVDLTGWSPADVQGWLADQVRPGPRLLGDPAWLADGYRQTQDLRAADDTSFRFVLSAVLAMARPLWEAVGGFDESFDRYGGEDWELAQRCWLAGADLVHEPAAVAWHDGPDLAGRGTDLVRAKNAETVHLAQRLTHPLVRGGGLVHAVPDVVIEADVTGWSLGQVVLCAESLLRGADAGLWLTGADDDARAALAEDPRVRQGEPTVEATSRCRYRVVVTEPVTLVYGTVLDVVDADADARPGALRVWSTRALGRARLHGDGPVPARGVPGGRRRTVPADVVIERWRQAHRPSPT